MIGYAAANWATEILCLAACADALGLDVRLVTIGGMVLGVQIVRHLPLTPAAST